MATFDFVRARVTIIFETISVTLPPACPRCRATWDSESFLFRDALGTGGDRAHVIGQHLVAEDESDFIDATYPTALKLGCCGYEVVPGSVEMLNLGRPPCVTL